VFLEVIEAYTQDMNQIECKIYYIKMVLKIINLYHNRNKYLCLNINVP